jgi:hypothetical protein
MEIDPIKFAQSKTRPQWIELWRSTYDRYRELVRAGGDKSVIGSFVAGVCLVLFYKIIITIAILAVIVAAGIYFMAPEEAGPRPPKDHSNP